jgi:hypothetical protein
MTAMHILVTATATLGGLLILWLLHLVFSWRKRTEVARRDQWAVADHAPITEADAFVRDIRAAAADVRTIAMDTLPSAEARTELITTLREACPRCGIDHTDECADMTRPVETVPAIDDYITGEIVAYHEPATQTDLTPVLMSKLNEFHSEWHWVGGELFPPTGLVNSLHDDDWLKQLLEQDLVAA